MLPFVMVALVRASHESVTAAYTPVVLLLVIWLRSTAPESSC